MRNSLFIYVPGVYWGRDLQVVLINVLKDVTRHVVMVMSWVSIWEGGSPRKRCQLYLMEVLRICCILWGG